MTQAKGPKRHHIIPILLLKRFIIDSCGDEYKNHVFLHRKEFVKPKKVSIRDVYVVEHFYTLPDGDRKFFEEKLGDIESAASPVIDEILDNKPIDNQRKSILIKFIDSLIARGYIFNIAKDYAVRTQKEFADTLAILDNLPGLDLPQRIQIKNLTDRDPSYFGTKALLLFKPIVERELIKNAELMNSFKWELLPASTEKFILGDTGAVWFPRVENDSILLPIVDMDNLNFLVLPLTPEIGLLGRHPRCDTSKPTTTEINKRIALTSFSSFISSKNTKTFEMLRNEIGVKNHLPSSSTFFEWILEENIKNNLPCKANLHHTCKATVKADFQKGCSLGQKEKGIFIKLGKTFEQHSKSLSLVKPFRVRCTFTDSFKHTNHDFDNTWIYEVFTRPHNPFSRHIIINTRNINNLKQDDKVNALYFFFLMLFLKASSSSLVQIQKSSETDSHNFFIIQTLQNIQQTKNLTPLSYELFKKIVDVQSSNPEEIESNILLGKFKREVLSCLDLLSDPYVHRKKIFHNDRDITVEVNEELAEKFSACISVSLVSYFAIATAKQRNAFWGELLQKNEFRFIFEDKWESISTLISGDDLTTIMQLGSFLEHIKSRCVIWLLTLLRD